MTPPAFTPASSQMIFDRLTLRRSLTICLICLAAVCLLGSRRNHDPVFNQIEPIVRSLSAITGLTEEHPVPYAWMSKAELRHFLTKRIKKTLKPKEIYADELALKMFGLVPQNYDLRQSTVDLLTEQAAAFYDYDKKKLFLLEGSSSNAETVTTLAHELSHALADQHFDLGRFMDQSPASDDENLAHTAVVEGQASWLMLAYDLKQAGQPAQPTSDMLKAIGESSKESMTDYPVLKDSPLYIQQSLLFPYTEGVLFFDAVYKKMGKEAFAEVFRRGPVETAEIIHPDRYFAHEKVDRLELPKLALDGEASELTDGSVGEFDHETMLEQYVGKAQSRALAPHLRAGYFRIMEVGKPRKPLLEYMSEWDSTAEAAAFFASYKKILHAKWQRCSISTATAAISAGEGDNGYFVVRLTGDRVLSVEGVADRTMWERLAGSPATLSAGVN